MAKVDFEKVYDLFAIRIIVNNTIENDAADCWKIYSLVTDIYSPDPCRLRDWISYPKPNGYESLHTTVTGPEGQWVEIQIRTRYMDEVAEKGYAAHWKYKSEGKEVTEADLFTGLRELLKQPARVSLGKSIAHTKCAQETDDIFIFTPKGDLKKLKLGYSVPDFAYEIHSEIGSTCIGAIVNGKMVPLKHTLMNGDTVRILTSRAQKPHESWLEIVKSPLNIARVNQALKMESYEGAQWRIQPVQASREASFPESVSGIKAGKENYVIIDPRINKLHYQFARCCDPVQGNTIFAFVSVTQGIKIHRTTCANAHQLITRYPYRVLESRWKE